MRALVVDDDDFDRETCRRTLESASCEVLEAETPEEALAVLTNEEPLDVIVSDFDLKADQNGVELLAHTQKIRPDTRRILMSGLLPPALLESAKQRGHIHSYFEKPDTLDGWRQAIDAALPPARNVVTTAGRTNNSHTGSTGTRKAPATAEIHQPTREQALEERVRWLSAVVDLGAEAHAGASLQETFDRAVQVVSETLDMEYTKILKLLPSGKEVLLMAGVGWKPGLVGKATVSTGMDSQAGYTLASEHPVVAEDLRAETRFSGPALLHEHGVVSGLSVVIPGEGGKPWGVFGAHTKERRTLTEDHALFLRAVANVVAGAITRDHAEDTLRNTKDVLEREVAERTRELRTAVDDLQAFNAMVAHDLRAPLRTIGLSVSMFVHDHGEELTPKAQDLLANVETATGQMRNLLEDLLSFAKATQDPLKMQDVDVTALAYERWEHIRQSDPERDVRFRAEKGLTAHADERFIAVVLDNLLGNAMKFTRGVPDASVELGAMHLPEGGTAFYVRDNGAGFPPERASQLFHPFKRLHPAKDFEGTGIGLATVRRIVERHQGTVWATSPGPGKGATVYFRLLPSGLP